MAMAMPMCRRCWSRASRKPCGSPAAASRSRRISATSAIIASSTTAMDLRRWQRPIADFSPADRVNLVTDAWALVQAGGSDAKSWLDLTRELADESEYAIWQNVADALLQIESLARGSAGREAFRAYARELLRPVLERLGWEPRPDDDPLTLQLRT